MKPRGVLVAGNWKMNLGPKAAGDFLKELARAGESRLSAETKGALSNGSLQACVIPPAVSLPVAVASVQKFPFALCIGAQNAHWEKQGAFTGEISGPMLQEIGVKTVLVGHSERRQFFGETDQTCRKRTESLLEQGFRVIFCIGETRAEREAGQTHSVLLRQLSAVFSNPESKSGAYLDGRLVIAYEPVWAIGTGLTATPAQAEEAHQMIRKFLWDLFGMERAGRTLLLYGGSVTPENCDSLLACPNVDGALVGGASLKPDAFLSLLESAGRALKA